MSADDYFLGDEQLGFGGSGGGFGNITLSQLLEIFAQLTPEQYASLKRLLDVRSDERLDVWLMNTQDASSYSDALMQHTAYRVHKALLLYIPPVIIVLGTFGNIFSFVILRRKTMLKFSTYFYLMVLAVADTFVLYFGLLPIWISALAASEVLSSANWICKTITALGYIVSDFSVWLIIAVTVERFIVVCRPLQASRLCNNTTARNIAIGLFLMMLAINAHFFWTVEVQLFHHQSDELELCRSAKRHEVLVDVVWPWVDAVLYSFAPFFIIMILNSLIIHQVMLAKRLRLAAGSDYEQRRPSHESSTRLTVMLLTISFAFLLTTLPMNIVSIAAAFLDSSDLARVAQFELARTVTQLLMYVNHSMNFFLYCATGQKFRTQLMWVVCNGRRNYMWGSDGSNGKPEAYSKSGCQSVYSRHLLSKNGVQHPDAMKSSAASRSGKYEEKSSVKSRLQVLLKGKKKTMTSPAKHQSIALTVL